MTEKDDLSGARRSLLLTSGELGQEAMRVQFQIDAPSCSMNCWSSDVNWRSCLSSPLAEGLRWNFRIFVLHVWSWLSGLERIAARRAWRSHSESPVLTHCPRTSRVMATENFVECLLFPIQLGHEAYWLPLVSGRHDLAGSECGIQFAREY